MKIKYPEKGFEYFLTKFRINFLPQKCLEMSIARFFLWFANLKQN
jgi:hypothetical protein